jgi:hypothetical protein
MQMDVPLWAWAAWTLQHALTAQPERVARGLDACRAAVRRGRPELLVAEETTARAEADVVAGLIDTVIDRGGWVALAHDGALEPHGGIALVLDLATAVGPVVQDEVADAAPEVPDGRGPVRQPLRTL